MKPATEKKVKEITARAKDLRSTYIREIRALADPEAKAEEKEVPRVSAIVIREGRWLVKIANKFVDRHDLELDEADTKTLLDANSFFENEADIHEDELKKNGFIFRMPVQFILLTAALCAMIVKFDAKVKAKIAQIEADEMLEEYETPEGIKAHTVG